jgi:hypothetical protein
MDIQLFYFIKPRLFICENLKILRFLVYYPGKDFLKKLKLLSLYHNITHWTQSYTKK